ncbi:unnamed protein product [Ranitomeya imitator]|uniref:Uncharacterized protein n=1 Tax=Ranitomeya imitator TaxID=111125 RepID=A0ABN9KT12_9NEOB|nr:unnamed protein product [Ranitomeya imitator]
MAEEDSAGTPLRGSCSMSRLSQALSHTHLDLLEQEAMVASPLLPPRPPGPAASSRKRKLSKSQSLSGSQESLSGLVSEARVLVVNTGGTIGMMYQNEDSTGGEQRSRAQRWRTDSGSDTDNDPDRCSVAVWSLESCHTDRSPATNDAGNQGKHRTVQEECRAQRWRTDSGRQYRRSAEHSAGGQTAVVLAPQANAFAKALKKLPILHDEQYAQQTKLYDFLDFPENTLVLPLSKQNKRIVYTVLEYSPLLDSCNMTTYDWAKIAKDIKRRCSDTDNNPDRCSVAVWSLESCHTDSSPATNDAGNQGKHRDGNQGKHRVTKRGPALSYPMFTLVTSEDIAGSVSHTPIQRCPREIQRRNKVLDFVQRPTISQQGPDRWSLSHITISLTISLLRHKMQRYR